MNKSKAAPGKFIPLQKKSARYLFLGLTLGLAHFPAAAQEAPQVIPLWEKGAPGFEERRNEPEQAASYWVKNVHNPSITVFLPPKEKASGAAIIVCPGGGFRELGFNGEGVAPAMYLTNFGIAAFALKYRLPRETNSPYSLPKHALQDGQRAMRLVRSHAKEWGIDPNRIGMMGFSAGGEVVSLTTYNPGDGDPNASDPIDRLNASPNFQIMIYPGPLGILLERRISVWPGALSGYVRQSKPMIFPQCAAEARTHHARITSRSALGSLRFLTMGAIRFSWWSWPTPRSTGLNAVAAIGSVPTGPTRLKCCACRRDLSADLRRGSSPTATEGASIGPDVRAHY